MIKESFGKSVGNIARYEMFIVVGILMTIGTLLKLVGQYDINSDWFWFLAGMGLVVEGSISYVKQKRFEKKFKIIEKEEWEKIMAVAERRDV